MLPSKFDTSKAIVLATGEILDISSPPTTPIDVENENSGYDPGLTANVTYVPLHRTPIVPGTLVGVVYRQSVAVQQFTVPDNENLQLTDLGSPSVKIESATFDSSTNRITAIWNAAPGKNWIKSSYQHVLNSKEWQRHIDAQINKKIWSYFEVLYPRRILLTNPQWEIKSFDSVTGVVCVDIYNRAGTQRVTFTFSPQK
jgi:hypothetical protein